MEAIGSAARAIKSGEMEFAIAGGVESMSRAPFVMGKADEAFSRKAEVFDTTIGWRFINPLMKAQYGVDSMPETGENVAEEFQVSRADQDKFALRSQQRAAAAQKRGYFADEIVPVEVPSDRAGPNRVDKDEHPRADTTLERLAKLPTPFREGGTVTAGNSSGINDGAAALVIASEERAQALGVEPLGAFVASAVAGVDPRVMGIGPVPAVRKLLERAGIDVADLDLVELNEAFASQSLVVIRELGLDPERVNVNGGAIALGHPLGMSGARLVVTLLHELKRRGGKYGLATLCVGVGQGQAALFER
jgi:3-oxoadipyl-CoA thiolase